MPSNLIRTAIVGLGYWGRVWARILSRQMDLHLRYFCDPDERSLSSLKANFGYVNMTGEVQDILKDNALDLVIIAAPTQQHYDLTKKALLAGKHVLVEQPLATSPEEALELVGLARDSGRLLFVGHVDEFSPGIIRLEEMVRSGELGEPLYSYSQRLNLGVPARYSSLIHEFASHDVYILLRILKRRCLSVSAQGFSVSGNEQPLVVFMNLEFEGGCRSHLQMSWLDPRKVRKMTLVGEKKMVRFDDLSTEAPLTIYNRNLESSIEETGNGSYFVSQRTLGDGDILIPHLPPREPLMEEAKALIQSLKAGPPWSCPVALDTAVEVVRIIKASDDSLENKGLSVGLE